MPPNNTLDRLTVIKWKARPILSFGIAISLLVSGLIFENLKRSEAQQIDFETKKIVADFDEVFRRFVHPLEGIASALHFSEFSIDPKKFRQASAARDFYKNFHGALGFGFIRRVASQDLPGYLAHQKKLRPNFQLHRLGEKNSSDVAQGTGKMAHQDGNLFVIEVVEPVEANQAAIGLVVSDEESRKAGALISMMTGEPTVTSPIQLVQVGAKEVGFLLFKPVYKSAAIPSTQEAREQELIGWAYSPILLKNVLADAEARNEIVHIERLFLKNKSEDLQMVYESKEAPQGAHGVLVRHELQSLGNRWVLELDYDNQRDWSPLVKTLPIFIIMLAASFLVFAYLRSIEIKTDLFEKHLLQTKKEVLAATREISEQKVFLQKIIDMVPAMVGYWDRNLINRLSNQAYFEYFGKKPEEILGLSMQEVVGASTFDKNKPFVEAVLQGQSQTFERELLTASGLKITMSKYIPDVDQKGEVVGFFVLVVDFTEMKNTQKELDQQKILAAQNDKLRSLGEMAAGMAHEINNPLAIINGSIQLLGKFREDPEKFKSRVQQIGQSVDRIAKIIGGLRKFAHTSEKEPQKNISVDRLIESSLVLVGAHAKNKGVAVSTELAANLTLFVNEIECEQILVNLIGNAIDAVKENSDKWAKVKAFAEGSHAVIQVHDSGHGIPLEIEKKLFEPFFTTKVVGEGTGLGLSISKGLAEKNGGSLKINRSFKNTCFELRIPLAQDVVVEEKHAV